MNNTSKRSGLSPIAYRSKWLPAPTAKKVTPAGIHGRLAEIYSGKSEKQQCQDIAYYSAYQYAGV